VQPHRQSIANIIAHIFSIFRSLPFV